MQVARRALAALRALSTAEDGITLTDLADQIDIPFSTMHRLATVLEEYGWLSRSPTNRRFFLGPAASQLAGEERPEPPLTRPHDAVQELQKRTGESVFVTELIGEHVLCTALAEASRPTPLFAQLGQSMPLHAASSARVILAYQSDEVVLRMLAGQPLVAFTRATPRTVDGVLKRLRLIRLRGYDTSDAHIDDVFVAAAPVRLSTRRVRAGLAVAVPFARLPSDSHSHVLTEAVLEAAAAMSSDLGYGGGREESRSTRLSARPGSLLTP
ncbi:IclR family transcriptional regulator [Streptomyces sp. NBC_00466]|uniref:IclR family transcriptional regulator n=1 Tax=Streptomyces sp. NBC_00466 TaxID=2903655 RepID=UPI0030E57982